MKKKTVIAGNIGYALHSAGLLFASVLIGVLFYIFAAQRAADNKMGIYLLEILPDIVTVVFSILSAVFFMKLLTELQFATFRDDGVSFRSVLFSLGTVKWDELVAVRYQSIEIKVTKRYGRYSKRVYEPHTFIVLQTKEYRRAPQGRINAKYGEYLRVLPESATLTVTAFLGKYRPDLRIECYE